MKPVKRPLEVSADGTSASNGVTQTYFGDSDRRSTRVNLLGIERAWTSNHAISGVVFILWPHAFDDFGLNAYLSGACRVGELSQKDSLILIP